MKSGAIILLCGAGLIVATAFQGVIRAETEPWVAPKRAARQKNPIPTSPESLATGKKAYDANCLTCHGPLGKGDGAGAATLEVKPRDLSDPNILEQSDGSIFWKIGEGRTPMPTFEKLIPEIDRWSLINYVRALTAKPGLTSLQADGSAGGTATR